MKWTPDDHGCIYDETGCFARLTPNKAERLASRHNADIDALTAERDELQRRLDNVVAMLEPAPDEKLQKMYAEDLHVEYTLRELYPRACAIAEGREG